MTARLTRRRLLALALFTPVSAGCSRQGGAGLFGGARPETLEPRTGYVETAFDRRPLIEEVTAMRVEQTPGGVIVHATGLAPPGFWLADLVPLPRRDDAPDTLQLEFRVLPPLSRPDSATSTQRIDVGYYLSNPRLDGVRTITVIATQNSRSSRR